MLCISKILFGLRLLHLIEMHPRLQLVVLLAQPLFLPPNMYNFEKNMKRRGDQGLVKFTQSSTCHQLLNIQQWSVSWATQQYSSGQHHTGLHRPSEYMIEYQYQSMVYHLVCRNISVLHYIIIKNGILKLISFFRICRYLKHRTMVSW